MSNSLNVKHARDNSITNNTIHYNIIVNMFSSGGRGWLAGLKPHPKWTERNTFSPVTGLKPIIYNSLAPSETARNKILAPPLLGFNIAYE